MKKLTKEQVEKAKANKELKKNQLIQKYGHSENKGHISK